MPRDEGFKNLVWDYEHEDENERKKGEPSALKILKELNGFFTEDPSAPLRRFRRSEGRRLDDLRVVDLFGGLSRGRARISPTGARPTRQANPARNSTGVGHGRPTAAIMYNRASADPEGKPWSEKKEMGVVGCGGKKMGRLRRAGLHRSQTA